jgi:hypothetical protein
MESFLKECKQGRVIEVTLCSFDPDKGAFLCSISGGAPVQLPVEQADNYYCMSSKDFKRVKERCKLI